MSHYRRYRVPGACYFFTVNLQNRRQRLLVDYIDVLRSVMRKVQQQHPFYIDAMVVLPEHLHCIWTLPVDDADFSLRWRQIKANFSRQLPKHEPLTASRAHKQERGIWQRRFWEHVIRDETDFSRHVDYIYFNPVKHGLVARVVDWPFSSFHRDVQRELYPATWGASYVEVLDEMGESGLELMDCER